MTMTCPDSGRKAFPVRPGRAPRGGIHSFPLGVLAILSIGFSVATGGEPGRRSAFFLEPGVGTVPANHLKFYLHFPEPMERGEVFRHLRLVEIDGSGNEKVEVPEPFREVELWDETFTRLTLWFHPGRQKPGVNLNLEIGPILEEGRRYRLEVSPKWRTESGELLEGDLSREFEAGPFDDVQPDPARWMVFEYLDLHAIGVKTDGPLDPESGKKRIRAFVDDLPVPIRIDGDIVLIPVSRTGWDSGRLVIDPALEDLAGNSIARPFNLDLGAEPDFVETTEPVVIEFSRPLPLVSPTGSRGTAPATNPVSPDKPE